MLDLDLDQPALQKKAAKVDGAYCALCLIFLLLRFNRLILFFFHFPLMLVLSANLRLYPLL